MQLEPVIAIFDWQRMLLGDEPPLFFFEIIFRTFVIYVYTLVLLRWLGSRTIGQLSTVEFLLVIALGSAVGDAMFYPDVPLLHAIAVITVVVVANKGLDLVIERNDRAERVVNGSPQEAIRDGVLALDFLKAGMLSRGELFQQLRERGVEHLGQVASAYLETDGGLTVFRADMARPGLPIVPPWEISAPVEARPGQGGLDPVTCSRCGRLEYQEKEECSHCGSPHFVRASR